MVKDLPHESKQNREISPQKIADISHSHELPLKSRLLSENPTSLILNSMWGKCWGFSEQRFLLIRIAGSSYLARRDHLASKSSLELQLVVQLLSQTYIQRFIVIIYGFTIFLSPANRFKK